MAKIHPTAQIDNGTILGPEVSVWANTHVRENTQIGDSTIIGEFCYIGPNTKIGNNCKIQNGAYIYQPCIIEDGVFIGPRVVITNDKNPRAINPGGSIKNSADWVARSTIIKRGASVGAGAVIVAPLIIGEWAMVGAGSVLIHDLPDFALAAGVPARQIGWVGRNGYRLNQISKQEFNCPFSDENYRLNEQSYLEFVG